MDLRGGHRRTPLIEEPRRPPWVLILILVLAGTVIAWAVSNLDLERVVPKPERSTEVEMIEVVTPVEASTDEDARRRWAVRPRPRYPDAALAVGAGEVRLGCIVQPDFSLNQCVILQETPPGYGFGVSALASARDARVTSNSPVGARVDFTLRYLPPEN